MPLHGGVAVFFYIEPVLTYDFDVVCHFQSNGPLINPSPIFTKLKQWGFRFGPEDRVTINGVPVQFIPASPGLMEEALNKAAPVRIYGVKTKILRAEYLVASYWNCIVQKIVQNWIYWSVMMPLCLIISFFWIF